MVTMPGPATAGDRCSGIGTSGMTNSSPSRGGLLNGDCMNLKNQNVLLHESGNEGGHGEGDLLGLSHQTQEFYNSQTLQKSYYVQRQQQNHILYATGQSQRQNQRQNQCQANDDLLGLNSNHTHHDNNNNGYGSSNNISSKGNGNDNDNTNIELLALSYNYEGPKPLPTADLLGFSVEQSHENYTTTSAIVTNNINHTNELLSLDYNPNNTNANANNSKNSTSMKINDAYIALEQMRVANLEIEFSHTSTSIDTNKCVQCLRQSLPSQQSSSSSSSSSKQSKNKKYNNYYNSMNINNIFFSPKKTFRFKNDKPCMMCGSPTCKKHSDDDFSKAKIVICTECSPLFSLDFIIECVCLNIAADNDDDDDGGGGGGDNNENENENENGEEKNNNIQEDDHDDEDDQDNNGTYEHNIQTVKSNDTTTSYNSQKSQQHQPQQKRIFQPKNTLPLSPKEQLRRRNIKHMVDVYDRVHLMLTYSAQFIDEIATKLETNTRREDQVGLSSNSIGIASGLAGIAAAAAVVTPAGPPLIIASLLFGATAQASSSGSKLVNYYSAPNKVALKIISYYNLLKSILVVTNVLRDALLVDNIDVEHYVSRRFKAHDEAMLHLSLSIDEDQDGERGGDNDGDKSSDSNKKQQQPPPPPPPQTQQEKNSKPQSSNDDIIEFEDDWETADDFTVMSLRSKSSMSMATTTNQTLGGIKENEIYAADDDNDGFGDFQKADDTNSFDTNSIASPSNFSPTSDTFSLSPIQKALDDVPVAAGGAANSNDPTVVKISPTSLSSSQTDVNSSTINKVSSPPTNTNSNTTSLPYPTNPTNTVTTKTKKSNTNTNTDDILMERKDTAGKLARFYSRTSLAGSSLVGAATVTVFAGAALSLAHVAFEANNFASTIKRLQAGSPSKRAKILRAIKRDIMNIPNTSVIAEEWDKYLSVLDEKRRRKKC